MRFENVSSGLGSSQKCWVLSERIRDWKKTLHLQFCVRSLLCPHRSEAAVVLRRLEKGVLM